MADPEADAREMYAEEQPWWHHGLIRDLDERTDGLGYEWVERCVRMLLPDIETVNKAELLADLHDLSQYRSRPASLDEFKQKSLEIWYRPNRDRAQSAVSKLYAAAAARLQYGKSRSLMDLAAPVYLLLEESTDRERHRDICVQEYASLRGTKGPAAECSV